MVINFPVPTEKKTRIKHFADQNSLVVKIEGNLANIEFLETYKDGIMKALATFEADYENKTQDKIAMANPEEDRPI